MKITFVNKYTGYPIKQTSMIALENCTEDSFLLNIGKYDYIPAQWEGVVKRTELVRYNRMRCYLFDRVRIKEIFEKQNTESYELVKR